jgi:hypothetical protein
MDLYANSKTDELEHILKENGIEVRRLRGLRLMKEEKPISEKELEEAIREAQQLLAVHWLESYSKGRLCFGENRRHKAFLFGKADEFGYREPIGVDFSKVHGKDRKEIKRHWKELRKDFAATFEMWNRYAGKDVLYVHARQGGGNRADYPIDTKHPMYLADVDDPWDSTYCDIYYDLSKKGEE